MALELEVYGVEDLFTKKGLVPTRTNPSILDELKGPGAGAFSVRPDIANNPDTAGVFAWRNVVKVRDTQNKKCLGAFVIQNKSEVFVDDDEEGGRYVSISGEGLRTWFHDATIYPMGGLNQYSADSRVFSFASEQGAWYNPAQWVSPVNVAKYLAAGTQWGTAPAQWPDEPNAYWIWDRAGAVTSAPIGTIYLRREFTLAADTSCSLFIAVDNTYNVYIDAQNIGSYPTADVSNFQQTNRIDFTLGAGNHVLAIEATNTGGPAGVMAALRSNGNPNAPATVATTIFKTGDAGWKMLAYPAAEPGWTTGMILLKLLDEAETRGVKFPTILQPTFTDTLDSNGVAWADAQAWSFDVGAEYTTVLEKIEELNADIWIDPETYALNAVKQRGTDRTVPIGANEAVQLRIGKNVMQGSSEGSSDMKNALLMKTADGWFEKQSTGPGSATYGRMEAQAATDAGKSLADTVASFIFQQHDQPSTSVTYDFLTTSDIMPWDKMFVGDYVLAPDTNNTYSKQRVSSLSATEDKAGNVVYAAEFGTLIQDKIDRLEKRLDNISNGASGTVQGSSSNVTVPSGGTGTSVRTSTGGTSGSPGGGTTLPTPAVPANLQGDCVGYFAPDGTPKSRFRLRWSAVTQDTTTAALTPDHYDVWARRSRTVQQRTTTNLHTNPSFESGVTDVTGFAATATQSSTWAQFGTRSLKISPNSSSISSYASLGGGAGGLRSGMAAGNWYNVSAYMRLSGAQSGTVEPNARSLAVIYRDVNGNLQQYVSRAIPNVANTTYRASLAVFIPAGATEAWIQVVNGTSTSNPVDLYVDGVQVTLGTTLHAYIDGAQVSDARASYNWTGTPHASSSTLVVVDNNIFVGSVQNNAVSIEGILPGDNWIVSVTAVAGIMSGRSAEITVTAPFPDTQLGIPTDPVVTSAFGFVSVHWDGLLSGTTPDATFTSVFATMGSFLTDTFVPVGQSLTQAGDIIIPNLVAGDVKYFKLQAYDKAGNLSGSTQPIGVTVAAGAGGTSTTPPVPVGGFVPYGGGSAPSGWLLCDGSAVSRSTYADLFSVIGTNYGAGDGSSTFNVPNMKGRVPAGFDTTQTEFNALGKTGGEKTHQLTIAEMPAHNHVNAYSLGTGGAANAYTVGPVTNQGATTGTTGGDGPHNNLQPYVTVNYIIKATTSLDTGGTSGRISYGTIEPYYSNGRPSVTFDGDTGLSGPYSWLPPYVPVANDRVALAKDPAGGYLILGKGIGSATFSNRVALPLSSGWTQYSNDFNGFTVAKSEHGLVMLEGLLQKGPTVTTWSVGEVIATLPPGFRPDYDLIRSVYAYQGNVNDAQRTLIIRTNGDIVLGPTMATGGSGNFLTVTNIYFFAAGYATWKVVGVDSGYSYGTNVSAYTDGTYNYGPLRIYQEPTSGIVFIDGVIQKTANFAINDILVSYPTALGADFSYIFGTAGGPNGNVMAEFRTQKYSTASNIFFAGNNATFSQRMPVNGWWKPQTGATIGFTNLSGANGWLNYDNGVTYCPWSYGRMGSVTLLRGLMKSGTVPATMSPALNAAGLSIPGNPAGTQQGTLQLAIAADAIARLDHRPIGSANAGAIAALQGANGWFAIDGTVFSPTA